MRRRQEDAAYVFLRDYALFTLLGYFQGIGWGFDTETLRRFTPEEFARAGKKIRPLLKIRRTGEK